jgi:opacity protein-like surface antigen
MKSMLKGAAVLAVLAAVSAAPAHAQGVKIGLGGGVTMPLGDFGDVFKTGFNGQASLGFQPASLPVGIQIDGNYMSNKVDADLDVKSQIIGGSANAVYTFKTSETSKLHPYIIAGAGAYNLKATGDDAGDAGSVTKFGINGGAGFNFMAGSVGAFVEGRFHDIMTEGSSTNLVNLNVGVRFGGK